MNFNARKSCLYRLVLNTTVAGLLCVGTGVSAQELSGVVNEKNAEEVRTFAISFVLRDDNSPFVDDNFLANIGLGDSVQIDDEGFASDKTTGGRLRETDARYKEIIEAKDFLKGFITRNTLRNAGKRSAFAAVDRRCFQPPGMRADTKDVVISATTETTETTDAVTMRLDQQKESIDELRSIVLALEAKIDSLTESATSKRKRKRHDQ